MKKIRRAMEYLSGLDAVLGIIGLVNDWDPIVLWWIAGVFGAFCLVYSGVFVSEKIRDWVDGVNKKASDLEELQDKVSQLQDNQKFIVTCFVKWNAQVATADDRLKATWSESFKDDFQKCLEKSGVNMEEIPEHLRLFMK